MGALPLEPEFDRTLINWNQQFDAVYPTVSGTKITEYKFTVTAVPYDPEAELYMFWDYNGSQVPIQNGVEFTCSALETEESVTFHIIVNMDSSSFDSAYTITIIAD